MKCQNCGKLIEQGNICDKCKNKIEEKITEMKDYNNVQDNKLNFINNTCKKIGKFLLFISAGLAPIHIFIYIFLYIKIMIANWIDLEKNSIIAFNSYGVCLFTVLALGIIFTYLSGEKNKKLLLSLLIIFVFIILHGIELINILK